MYECRAAELRTTTKSQTQWAFIKNLCPAAERSGERSLLKIFAQIG